MNSDTTTLHPAKPDPRSGVALIMVLGLLAVLTIMCVAFAISMRVERQAARAFANNTRAEQLMSITFVRSMERVNSLMRDPDILLYPDFPSPNPSRDAIASQGERTPNVPDLRTGEALDFIPQSLQTEVDKLYRGAGLASYSPQWITEDIPGGRIAYILINASGLLDANLAGGTNTREFSEHIGEIDISGLPDVAAVQTFINDREEHVRYESTPEIRELNDGVYSVSNFFYYSFDPNRDEVFSDPNGPAGVDLDRPPAGLGLRSVSLTNKFDLNAITNYAGYWTPDDYDGYRSDATFVSEYLDPLIAILEAVCMENPVDVAWNIINYLDPDHVPQSNEAYPWRHSEGGEAIPLINEIVFEEVAPSNYQFAVELWYPFIPTAITNSDGFYLHVSVFTNANIADLHGNPRANELNIQSHEDAAWSFTNSIREMTFNTDTEFLVFRGPVMTMSAGGVLGDPQNTIRMLARVMKREGTSVSPVDESMGYNSRNPASGGAGGIPFTQDYHKRGLFSWTGPMGFSVNDPRSNGQIKYWTDTLTDGERGDNYAPAQNTLGTTNTICDPWGGSKQGTPIYFGNNVMRNIGELGHIWRSNLGNVRNDCTGTVSPPSKAFWRTIELMKKTEGALLLDVIDVHSGGEPAFGLVSINTRQYGVLDSLFHNLEIGHESIPQTGRYRIPDSDINNLINTIISYATDTSRSSQQYMSFADLFEDNGGPLAEAFTRCAPDGHGSNDIYKEDTFRHISELITFRQNIFMVIGIAQALAPDNETVLAEKRAVSTIYRDAYTGRHFTRSFKWLND